VPLALRPWSNLNKPPNSEEVYELNASHKSEMRTTVQPNARIDSYPEFAGQTVSFNSRGQVSSVHNAALRDYVITPFAEVNWLLEALSATDNL